MFIEVKQSEINYKIGQKVESCRLIQGYNQRKLANKIGVTYQEINKYEQGYDPIPIEKLYEIAKALSVKVTDLMHESEVFNESDEDEAEKIVNIMEMYEKIEDKELRKIINLLIKSTNFSEENNKKAVKIEVAQNLEKAGISKDIISKATELSSNEYNNTNYEIGNDKESIKCEIGKRVKEVRLIRTYTQKGLASKMNSTPEEIKGYEEGRIEISLEKLYEIAEVLAVNVKVLLPQLTKYENSEIEFANEYYKIEFQETKDRVNKLVKFLLQSIEVIEEKAIKEEKLKIARALIKAGVSVKIICKATGLSADEFDG